MVNAISILTALLTLTAGIGVFLVACTMMSSNLESAALVGYLQTASRNRVYLPCPELRTCCRPPHQCGENHSGLTIKQYTELFQHRINTGLTQD